MRRSVQATRWLLALLTCLVLACPKSPPGPVAGDIDYQRLAHLALPGGVLNAAGGNLLMRRVDLSIDTRLGREEIGATYNSASGDWTWSFELTYDGSVFADASGAVHDVSSATAGQAIPGTNWVVLGNTSLKTKGGLVHEFGSEGKLERIRWSSSAYPSLEIASAIIAGETRAVRMDQCTAPGACNLLFDFQRDAQGQLVAIQDRAGRSADFVYDTSGQLIVARDGLDTARGWSGRQYEYSSGRLSAITTSEGERTELLSDGAGRLLEWRRIGLGDPTWSFVYRANPYSTELTDPTGAVTHIRFDGQRRTTWLTNGEGEVREIEWSGLRPSRMTAADGSLTEFVWQNDDLFSTRTPDGNLTTHTWAPQAVNQEASWQRALARREDDLGLLEERIYDAQGRLTEHRNGAGEPTLFMYGADEALTQVTTPDAGVIGYSGHGEHGHPTLVTSPLGTVHPRYDEVGNLIEGPDLGDGGGSFGGVVERSFDEDRNVSTVVLAEGTPDAVVLRSLTIQHRSDGQRTRITRPYGADSEWTFDALGRAVERRDRSQGAWVSTVFEFDELARPIARERANGMREEWNFDAAGRNIRSAIVRDGTLQSEALFAYQDGRLISVTDSAHGGAETLAYDASGRPSLITHPGGEQTWLAYDARSRVTARILSEIATGFLRTLAVTYDTAGREQTLWDGAVPILDRQYVNGRMTEISYGNGLVRSFAYGATGQLASTLTANAAGQTIETTDITESCAYFMPLCRDVLTETFGAVASTHQESFQLLAATESGPGSEGGVRMDRVFLWNGSVEKFEYDAVSNPSYVIHAAPGCGGIDTWSFSYDVERSRMLQAQTQLCGTGHTYSYDAAGYVVGRDGTALGWDGAGRIESIGADQFAWDTRGRPLSRTIAGTTTSWKFGGRVEANAAGLPTALDLGEVRIALGSGARLYRHHDFRNNVSFVTDDAGDIVVHYTYDTYGRQSLAGDGSADSRQRFAQGQELGGLVVLGHRVLDPDIGRFLAPDPVFQLINQYAYTLGNPLDYWDPNGLYQITVARALGIASVVVGTAGLVATAPAWAIGLGVVSIGLGIGSLVADALAPTAPTPPPCACTPPPQPPPPPPPPPPGGPIRNLEIHVEAATLDWSLALMVALHIGGLMF